MMSKYNDISVWEDTDVSENFGEELKSTSIFIYTSECMSLPCCVSYGCVNWFNNSVLLAGYVKYMVFNRIFSLIVDSEDVLNDDIGDIINKAVSGNIISTEDAEHMTEIYTMIDKCFDSSSENTFEILENSISVFKKHLASIRGFDFCVKLFKGLDELKPFVCDYFDKDSYYSPKNIDELFNNYTSENFETMLAEIIS